jgi:hypothetical protein
LAQFEATIGRRVQIFHQYLYFSPMTRRRSRSRKFRAREAIAGGRMYAFNLKPRDATGMVHP